MHKITIFLILVIAFSNNILGQAKGKFRTDLQFSIAIAENGYGLAYSVEPKYNLRHNMSVGLKLGRSAITKDRRIKFETETDLGSFSQLDYKTNHTNHFLGTFDYHVYFNYSDHSFIPYIGGGLGVFKIDGLRIDSYLGGENIVLKFDNSTELGFLLRTGFEAGKFKMGVQYFFIPETDMVYKNETIGVISNNFYNFYLGFYIGGGKWY